MKRWRQQIDIFKIQRGQEASPAEIVLSRLALVGTRPIGAFPGETDPNPVLPITSHLSFVMLLSAYRPKSCIEYTILGSGKQGR